MCNKSQVQLTVSHRLRDGSRLAYPTFGFWCLAITFYVTCFPKSATGPLTSLKFLTILFHIRFVTNRPRLLVSSHRDLLGTAAWGSSSALDFVEASKCNGPLTLPYHQTFCGVIFPESSRHFTVDILKTPFTIDACSRFLDFATNIFAQLLSSCNSPLPHTTSIPCGPTHSACDV
ncbi:hypothetical protein EDB89DRAFT_1954287 [Lactarius sanguifluus]|nr:hypothetical protein EDB89DRAFT_2017911 [Lactarius sanguifluus]KAH9174047.1 hypothetical protein EDB89DRAFT_1954287 [Lactarius sanguifluus]